MPPATAGSPEELQREAVLPVILAQFQKRPPLGRPGVVDQQVEPAESIDRRLDQRLSHFRIAQIPVAVLDPLPLSPARADSPAFGAVAVRAVISRS